MSSIEDEKKHEYIPLLLKEKEMDSLKYADDDDESTDGNIEENEEKNEPSTSHKNTDGNIEENEEENEPSTSHKETERKDNKPPDDSVERTDENSEENEHKTEHSTSHKKEMYASAIELRVEEYEIERGLRTGEFRSSCYSSQNSKEGKKAAMNGTKTYHDGSDNQAPINCVSEETIKEDELFIKVYTTSDAVVKTFRKDELFIKKEQLKKMCERFDRKVRELLRSNSVDVTHQDELDNTLLHYAVIGNSLDLLSKPSKLHRTLNTKGNFGLTPLHIAALLDYSDVARKLMNMKADIELKDKYDNTPLLVAAKYGSSKVIEILLSEKASINQTDNQRRSVLHLATEYNNTDVLELIFKKSRELGAKAGNQQWKTLLHMKTAEGKTALHQVVCDNRKEIVKILLQKDLDINDRKTCLNMQDAIGKTALHHAVVDNNKEMVEILLQEGADRNCKDNDERTPLSHAAERGMVDITRMLLDKGADTWALDKKEEWETDRDIHLSIEEQREVKKFPCLRDYLRAKRLKTHRGIDDFKNYEKMAPVHYAAANGHSEVVKMFSELDTFHARSGKGRHCLDIAIDENQVETVLEIIKSDQWNWSLRNKTDTIKGEHQSPMRKLIVHMPEVAREAFDKCTTVDGTADGFNAEFDYMFLDDTQYLGGWEVVRGPGGYHTPKKQSRWTVHRRCRSD